MEWDKSPIREESEVIEPPDAPWLRDQLNRIDEIRYHLKKKPGKRSNEYGRNEAQALGDHWDKRCNIELLHLPDLHLLTFMGHSPSGTLFPRYLVKGLYELPEGANDRGAKYYNEEYEKAKIKRQDAIHRWQD